MRKLLSLAARLVLVNMLVAGPALAGIALDQTTIITFTDCASGGSAAQTLKGGYLMTATDEDVWVCITDSGSTCASGGTRLPLGLAMFISIGNFVTSKSVSCRSAASTGDLQFTPAS